MRTLALACRLLPIALVVSAVHARSQDGQAVFKEAVDVEVVNVEVVVTDKEGNPVTGLEREDFRILEDGAPVTITNFYEARLASPEVGGGEQATAEGLAGRTRDLNLVIFVDNLTINQASRGPLFTSLREFLSEEQPAVGQMMLVSMGNRIEVAQPFTADRETILAALSEVERSGSIQAALEGESKIFMNRLQSASTAGGGPGASFGAGTIGASGASGNPNFDDSIRVALELAQTARSLAERRYQLTRASISSLTAFCSTLGGLPGRKAVLYLGDGLALRPADTLFEAWTEKYESWYLANEEPIRSHRIFREAGQVFQGMIISTGSNEFDLHTEIDRLGANASDNRVVVYPLSLAGRGASIVSASTAGSSGAVMRAAQTSEAQTRQASLLQMAEDTGGVALTSSANIDALMSSLVRDFTSFYSLGYEPTSKKRDEQFHRVEVEVGGEGLEVRHTKGYLKKTWRDRLGEMTTAAALLEVETNPLGVNLVLQEQQKAGKRYKVPILIQIPFRAVQMVSDGSSYSAELTVLVMVRDEKGGLSKPERIDLPIQIPNAQILAAREQAAAYPLQLEIDPGPHVVSVAVRDHIAKTASVVNLKVEVGAAQGG